MTEWLKVPVLKTGDPHGSPGFKSQLRRIFSISFLFQAFYILSMGLLSRAESASSKVRNITSNVSGSLEDIDSTLDTLTQEEKDEDQKESQLREKLNEFRNNPEKISTVDESKFLELMGKEGTELEDELQRMESDIQGFEETIEMLQEFEGVINSEEETSQQEIETVRDEIRGLNQRMSHENADKVIQDLEKAVSDLDSEADQLLKAAELVGSHEKEMARGAQLEEHMVEEAKRYSQDLSIIEELFGEIGAPDEVQEKASNVEELREDVLQRIKTETRQFSNEAQEEQQIISQLEQEINKFATETEEVMEEARTLEKQVSSSGFEQEDQELGRVVSKIEEINEKGRRASQMIGKEEDFFGNISSAVGKASQLLSG